MKSVGHIVRDILIFLISISGTSWLYRQWKRKKGPLARVVVFHSVRDEIWFEEVISFLVREFHVLTPKAFHEGSYRKDKINILITFDDGYRNWVTKVLPILEKYDIKATFFICSGLLDISDDKEKRMAFMRRRLNVKPKRPLNWSGAQLLVKHGHTIGGHTAEHHRLRDLSPEEQFEEIRKDKIHIETMLGVTLEDFAYPFGRREHYDEVTMRAVKECGYRYGYSALPGFAAQNGDMFDIPRTLIEKNQSVTSFRRWIFGAYDIFNALKL